MAGNGCSDSGARLAELVVEARERTLTLAADLTDEQWLGPRLAIVNPLRWEIGHVAWFQETWALRHAGGLPPLRADADALYDSAAIPHDVRWDLPLPGREGTLDYLRQVRDRLVDALSARSPTPELVYFTLLSVFHEDMHTEAFTYTRQTLGYPQPRFAPRPAVVDPPSPELRAAGDVALALPAGATFPLGAAPEEPFVFDNEKWAHPVTVEPFAIARTAVSQAEFLAFVEEGGYRRREFWSEAGWAWRSEAGAQHPVYWRRKAGGTWERRHFDTWTPLEPRLPVIHVNWYEADAYCRGMGRRLPTEAEWELAATLHPPSGYKRRFPWGDEPPSPAHANLDWRAGGCLPVEALPAGDSPAGCRQMIGNVWEWTSSDFGPYPDFAIDPYKEYSEPWFGTHKVLRGGCWTTRSRLLRGTWRNFYRPERRDVLAGFRTCARDG
jgi:iron(II)-dependent oxidoreductase